MNATWEFVKRHKGKIVAGGVLLGGAVAYAMHANENKTSVLYPQMQEDDLKTQARRHYVFDCNHRSCDQSIQDLVPSVKQLLEARFDVDALILKIKSGTLNAEEKLETWEKIKLTTFSRLVSQAYAYSILTVTLKAQISILAAEICGQFERPAPKGFGSIWLPKQLTGLFSGEQTTNTPKRIDNNSQQIFLQCIQFFTTKGILYLFDVVEAAVDKELKPVSLKEQMDRKKMRELLERVEKTMEDGLPAKIVEMVAPFNSQDEAPPSDGITRLLKRLVAVLESSWSTDTVSSIVDFYFAASCHKILDVSAPLAAILPSFADSFDAVSSTSFDSPLRNTLCSSDVHAFAMKVFKMLD